MGLCGDQWVVLRSPRLAGAAEPAVWVRLSGHPQGWREEVGFWGWTEVSRSPGSHLLSLETLVVCGAVSACFQQVTVVLTARDIWLLYQVGTGRKSVLGDNRNALRDQTLAGLLRCPLLAEVTLQRRRSGPAGDVGETHLSWDERVTALDRGSDPRSVAGVGAAAPSLEGKPSLRRPPLSSVGTGGALLTAAFPGASGQKAWLCGVLGQSTLQCRSQSPAFLWQEFHLRPGQVAGL